MPLNLNVRQHERDVHQSILGMSADDIKTLLSILAFGTSVASIVLTRRNWAQSNRPVVSAYIEEDRVGIGAATFNLLLSNTGTRPATNVRIHIDGRELEKLIDPRASPEARMNLAACFSRESKVALLRNGETLTGGFGRSSNVDAAEAQLQYGGEAEIRTYYNDLEGIGYESKQPIKVYARNGFTGNSWQSAA